MTREDFHTSTVDGAAAHARAEAIDDDHAWYGRTVRADTEGDYPTGDPCLIECVCEDGDCDPTVEDGFCHCGATFEVNCVCP